MEELVCSVSSVITWSDYVEKRKRRVVRESFAFTTFMFPS